jgi:oxygen-independent coproporphyrinogen-3 oxidase
MLELGVTRFSLGVQTLDDDSLILLGRRHDVSDVHRAVRMLRAAGVKDFGLDLISGVPGITESAWRRTIGEAARIRPAHISVYALTIEHGTPLSGRIASGELSPAADAHHLSCLAMAAGILRKRGYRRYEISNYALPGRSCRHNMAYWHGKDFAGFGPAGSSRIRDERRTNNPDLDAYLKNLERGQDAPASVEKLDPETDLAERFMFGFRMASGVSLATFDRRFGPLPASFLEKRKDALGRLKSDGLLANRGARWLPTARGMDLADTIASEFVDADRACD